MEVNTMGLDIYLYEVQKIGAHNNKVWTLDEIEDRSINIFDADAITHQPKTICDNCTKIKVKREYYNIPKILKDYGYDDTVHIELVGQSSDNSTFCVTDKSGKEDFIKISLEDIVNKYTFSQINKVYACKMEEVAYQRKGLNDNGWDLLPGNCEFSDDKANVRRMVKIGGLSEDFIRSWKDNHTVFYAWW